MIELLDDISKLNGKTIKSTRMIQANESLFVEFDDGTGAVLMGTSNQEVYLEDDIDNHAKLDAGIMSQDEFDEVQNVELEASKERMEARERAQLVKLLKKYPV